MAAYEQIQEVLRRAGRRRRWQRAWRGFWAGLLGSGVLWLAVLGLYKAFPLPVAVLAGGALLGLLLPVILLIAGALRSEPVLVTARWLDHQKGLQERLSTAVELRERHRDSAWSDLVVADAERRLGAVNLKELLPHHLPRTARLATLVLAVVAGLGWLPEYRSEAYLQTEREREATQEAGERLVELARRTLERRQPALEATEKSLQAVEELGNQLVRRPLSRDEALRDLAKLTEEVEDRLQELGKKPSLRALERATKSGGANPPGAAEELQKQIDSLQKQMEGKPSDPKELEQLADALERAREAASQMGAGSNGQESARAEMAEALSELARLAEELGAMMPGLEQALESLQAGEIDQMLQDLDLAMEDLAELLEMARSLEAMKADMAKMGKDLKEQLERGQAMMASGRLRKMAEELNSRQASPERLKEMVRELSEALEAAGQYGEVQELLKQGLEHLEAGEQAQAGQALDEAADALMDLMAQLGDAGDLEKALAALMRAQACVGNGQSWGQCQMPGRPGSKPGGRPGAGVGTWADDSQQMNPGNTGLWDNTGMERPDLDPRGLTDRGEGEPPDNLSATRVKGQFTPGGPMPGITLKGVSIKGQSRVALQEAMAAAQVEAQSALSQEEIPRAYQGAVRDYFDDLKE